jgi:TPP-dependent pyruvate/acetoin dehydrogenase alpha subunit
MRALAAELMGRSTGASGGLGGSQHLHFPGFYSNGVQGGIVPCAVGMALAEKRRNSGAIITVFLGDGTLGEGVVYESLNIASLWKLPVLFAVENNRYAQTTPVSANFAGDFSLRFKAFGIDVDELDTTDVVVISEAATLAVSSVRERVAPRAILLNTYRFSPHSKGDDFRDPAEIDRFRQFDPIILLRARLSHEEYDRALIVARDEVMGAFAQAEKDAWPDPAALLDARQELLKP